MYFKTLVTKTTNLKYVNRKAKQKHDLKGQKHS